MMRSCVLIHMSHCSGLRIGYTGWVGWGLMENAIIVGVSKVGGPAVVAKVVKLLLQCWQNVMQDNVGKKFFIKEQPFSCLNMGQNDINPTALMLLLDNERLSMLTPLSLWPVVAVLLMRRTWWSCIFTLNQWQCMVDNGRIQERELF